MRLLVEEIAVERMAIAGAVADHDGPMLAELFIGQWLLRLSQRVMGATTKMLSNAPRVCHDHSADVGGSLMAPRIISAP